ncbi:MAG: hypothetical protein U1E30_05960 [Rhodoblastus sp.]
MAKVPKLAFTAVCAAALSILSLPSYAQYSKQITSPQAGGASPNIAAVAAQPMWKQLKALPAGVNLQSVSVPAGTTAAPSISQGKAASAAPTNKQNLPVTLGGSVPVGGSASSGGSGANTGGGFAVTKSVASVTASLAPTAGSTGGAGIQPQNYGNGNVNTVYHYNDLLVTPAGTAESPHGTSVGYVLFTFDNSNWYYCTATLISNSIIVAAGHCAHEGNNSSNGWIKQAYFFPSCWNCNTSYRYYPYGYAQVAWATVTGGWYASGGLDQGYDISVMVVNKPTGQSQEFGTSTGYMGFCYNNCLQPNWFLTARGFPNNYFGGNWVAESQHHVQSDGHDFLFGTGMEGGSSGGPFIANIGTIVDNSTNLGQYTNRNVIFATRSWGYNDTSIKIGGASSLSGPSNTNNFKTMFNNACTQARSIHGTNSCAFLP